MTPDAIDTIGGIEHVDARAELAAAVQAAGEACNRIERHAPILALLEREDLLPGLVGCDAELARLASLPGCRELAAKVGAAARRAAKAFERARVVETPRIVRDERPEAGVWARLDRHVNAETGAETVRKSLQNLTIILEHDSRWKGRLRLNDFSGLDELDGQAMSDREETGIHLWMDRVYGLDMPTERVSEAVSFVANASKYHPIREWLEGLTWDGTERVRYLLTGGMGAEDTELNEVLARCFLVSAVARVMDPGCKVDTTLILVGPQGCLKSQAVAALAGRPEWYSDTVLDMQTKDLYESIQGVWLYELAELDSFRRSDWTRIKAILTSRSDRWRRPYGHRAESRSRQVVFVGTTNEDAFLGDPTGSRRFWPVKVATTRPIDLDTIKAIRDQLWAEALYLYRQGTRWWLTEEQGNELAAVSDEFRVEDPWEGKVIEYVRNRPSYTIAEVLEFGLAIGPREQTKASQGRVADILRQAGHMRISRTSISGRRIVIWGPLPQGVRQMPHPGVAEKEE